MAVERFAGERPDRRRPDYEAFGLANLPALVARALGAPTDDFCPPLPLDELGAGLADRVDAIVLLLVDGLGHHQLTAGADRGHAPTFAGLLAEARERRPGRGYRPITSVFPSSTVPALATLATGLPPARHGLLGWTMYLPELGGPTETVRFGPVPGEGSYADPELGGHDPVAFFGVETLHQRLRGVGVTSFAVVPAEYAGSPFSRMLYHGAEFIAHRGLRDLFATVERVLAGRRAGERIAVYAYWPGIDAAAHQFGPASSEHAAALQALDAALGEWLASGPRDGRVLFLLTADHGHVASDPARAVRLKDHPELIALLESPPTGERRAEYLHPRPGLAAQVREYVETNLREVAELWPSDDAFATGLFGPVEPTETARRRAGAFILLPRRPDVQFFHPFIDQRPPALLAGNHGALEPEELLAPLLAVRLER